jgi:hypothetical protein
MGSVYQKAYLRAALLRLLRVRVLQLLIAVCLPSSLIAAESLGNQEVCIEKGCFSAQAKVGAKNLPLIGAILYRYLVFDVYSIALYGPDREHSIDSILSDVPKKLVIQYHRDFTRDQIVRAGTELMRENKEINFELTEPETEKMNSLYVDKVSEGDQYWIKYVPGEGTSLYHNGRLLGSVPGSEFARAYFGIWLSRNPIDEDMRDALLSGKGRLS